jgi:hypothetical protein
VTNELLEKANDKCVLSMFPTILSYTHPLARQKYWEIRTNFTTLLLHNYKSKPDCEDYRKN